MIFFIFYYILLDFYAALHIFLGSYRGYGYMNKKLKDEHQHCDDRMAHHNEELKRNMVQRLNRIEGQIRGISKMIDENRYCDKILHQISSVESALDGVKTVLLEAHIKSCVIEQIKEGKGDDVLEELLVTLRKFLK